MKFQLSRHFKTASSFSSSEPLSGSWQLALLKVKAGSVQENDCCCINAKDGVRIVEHGLLLYELVDADVVQVLESNQDQFLPLCLT